MACKNRERSGASPALRKRLAQIKDCEKSGGTLKAYAERHGLSLGTLYQAKKQARRHGLLPPHRRQAEARTAAKSHAP